ncbi:hypothetical protein NDU88_001398 [Pleurodeles waltl]|uniref:Uncharacterized protein n=1 Tax=Pleurodeles waltl TaxID=8319 RepID=A0AAV7MNL5_PLEWA|nr:hypothetical protein NDU88_001398 [Pleurodeles waltl]
MTAWSRFSPRPALLGHQEISGLLFPRCPSSPPGAASLKCGRGLELCLSSEGGREAPTPRSRCCFASQDQSPGTSGPPGAPRLAPSTRRQRLTSGGGVLSPPQSVSPSPDLRVPAQRGPGLREPLLRRPLHSLVSALRGPGPKVQRPERPRQRASPSLWAWRGAAATATILIFSDRPSPAGESSSCPNLSPLLPGPPRACTDFLSPSAPQSCKRPGLGVQHLCPRLCSQHSEQLHQRTSPSLRVRRGAAAPAAILVFGSACGQRLRLGYSRCSIFKGIPGVQEPTGAPRAAPNVWTTAASWGG